MVVLTGVKKGVGVKIKKRLGKQPTKRPIFDQVLFNHIVFDSQAVPRPDPKDVYGIYRVRPRWNKVIQERMPFYTPSNPQTQTQQNWRGIFAGAVAGWQGLTDQQKAVYNLKAKYKNLSGYNLYLSEYLFSH